MARAAPKEVCGNYEEPKAICCPVNRLCIRGR
jgi:hypothetical protein